MTPRSGATHGQTASVLISKRIAELEDWRGETLARMRKLIKQAGFRSGVAVAQDMVRVRWHSGVREVIRGVTKNMFAACHYNAFIALCGMALALLMTGDWDAAEVPVLVDASFNGVVKVLCTLYMRARPQTREFRSADDFLRDFRAQA